MSCSWWDYVHLFQRIAVHKLSYSEKQGEKKNSKVDFSFYRMEK